MSVIQQFFKEHGISEVEAIIPDMAGVPRDWRTSAPNVKPGFLDHDNLDRLADPLFGLLPKPGEQVEQRAPVDDRPRR